MRQRIKQLVANGIEGSEVTVCGWIKSKRESKACAFVIVNDGSMQADLQLVVDNGSPASGSLHRCTTGASIRAVGTLKASPGQGQKWEVLVKSIEVLGDSDAEKYPLQKKGHTLEFLRDIGHLRARTNTFGAVFRVRNVLSFAVHEFFQSRGFVWAHTPIVTANDCEGAGEMFHVTTFDLNKIPKGPDGKIDHSKDFFGKAAHLTVSGQLEGEALALALGDIYTFGPTFRAENSNTTRHLAEFWMIEPEMAFADINDDMQLAEDFFRHLCRAVATHCQPELEFFEKHYKTTSLAQVSQLAEQKFQRITYTEAVKILTETKETFEFPVKWGIDLQSEHERFLTDSVFKGPVIVRDYPKDIKAFYMRQNDDGKTVAAMDVLAPRIGEIIGGSQREDRIDMLTARMQAMNIPVHDLDWYLDLRRFGGVPHAGFGLGFERAVQYLTGMGNIRDVIPFPRAPQTIAF